MHSNNQEDAAANALPDRRDAGSPPPEGASSLPAGAAPPRAPDTASPLDPSDAIPPPPRDAPSLATPGADSLRAPHDAPGEPGDLDPWGTPPPAAPRPAREALPLWLLLLLVFGAGGMLFRMEELAAMTAIAGLFVLSQAADMETQWRYLHYSVTWVVPACGLSAVILIGFQLFARVETPISQRMFLAPALAVAGLICVLCLVRPFANMVASALFRTPRPSHTLRLAARIVLVVLVLAVPAWFALRSIFDELFSTQSPLIDRASLEGQLVGYILLSLAGVGFLIRRNLRETIERLGIGAFTPQRLAMVAFGVVTLYALNAGADWVQQTFFQPLWESDHHVNEAIASGLGPWKIAVLGLSAGIGEEITLRGALQPKLGVVMTSLVFASLHLQYSWFGILVIFLLSLVLGTIRLKANTSAAMAVHVIYDVAALISV